MSVKILLFGQIAEIMGSSNMELEDIADTNDLQQKLHASYPALARTKYVVAVNKKLVSQNTPLSNGHTVAILPPFSGG